MPIINDDMKLDKVVDVLEGRGVADLSIRIGAGKVTAKAILNALAGPQGPAQTPIVHGATMGDALDTLCRHIDKQLETHVVIRDDAGRLRGLYPNTREGRRVAERHRKSLGRCSSTWPGGCDDCGVGNDCTCGEP